MKVERRTVPMQVKSVSEDGTFSGYLSVFGNVDSYNDVVERGAFKKTISDRSADNPVPILWQHYADEPIGVYTKMVEDDHGLYVEGQLALSTQRGKDAFELLKLRALKGLSIGYQVVNEAWDGSIRRLKEIKLWEGSIVTFPANELATVTSVKAQRETVEAIERMNALLGDVKTLLEAVEPGEAHSTDDEQGKGEEPDWSTLRAQIDNAKNEVAELRASDQLSDVKTALDELLAAA